ncbi:sensor histidine kinase [Floccifex sp.]|uniref:sensor histidine kinase n=1 Tax=Floccifex sp. TaxID=2815810 RepID=UPI003EFDC969
MNKKKEWILNLIKLLSTVFLMTLLGQLFHQLGFPETNIVVIYIFAVFLVARFTSEYTFGILSAILSIICYNYFFTVPYHTLFVNDTSYIITFSIMLITSILTSTLTTKEKLLTKEANEKGEETQILYNVSSQLSDAADLETVLKITVESISQLLQINVGCIYVGNQTNPIYIQQSGKEQIHRNIPNIDELMEIYSNLSTEYIDEQENYGYPVNGKDHLLAIIKIDKKVDAEWFERKKALLHSIIENVSMAMDRIEITIERIKDREKMERERQRANLLRSISHDLRTPLSGIMGTSEMLMDMMEKDDSCQKLLQGIYQDADWLKSLVENILNLTRLQDGKIVIHKEMEAIEEIIGSAVSHIERVHPEREIQVDIPDDFCLVPMDAKLIEQVFINLLDNAIKHTKQNQAIVIQTKYTKKEVEISVLDEGEGIAQEDLSNLFKIFYTSNKHSDSKKGIGLGLTICETVIKAHGGMITGRNRKDTKGAEFIFTLPLKEGTQNV